MIAIIWIMLHSIFDKIQIDDAIFDTIYCISYFIIVLLT
jgi:uncharacterized membrane protein